MAPTNPGRILLVGKNTTLSVACSWYPFVPSEGGRNMMKDYRFFAKKLQ